MKRALIILLGIVVLVVIAAGILLMPQEQVPEGEQSAMFYQPGTLDLLESPLELLDTSRRTDPNGEFPGTNVRLLQGVLWQPAEETGAPYPLVVYSHGFMSSAEEARYYAEFLVPKGYVVAAVNYPLSSGSAPGGANVLDVVNQPGDVSFVIDSLLDRNQVASDPLHGMIDPDRIAIAGLSLGGLTTLLSGFHGEWRDPRVKAIASIAGLAAAFNETFFATTDTPFLMIAGSADAIVPYEANAADITRKDDNATLITLDKASHSAFAAQAARIFRWFDHADEMVCPMLLENVSRDQGERNLLFEPDPQLGIVEPGPAAAPCQLTEFGRAMRPAEQLMLTRLALYSFMESTLARDAARREAAGTFLREVFPRENPGISVAVSEHQRY